MRKSSAGVGMGVDPWGLGEVSMEGLPLASVLHYEEHVQDLKHRLLCATLELETLRANVKEQMNKNEENISQLIQLLKVTSQERDEAKHQLQMLLNKILHPNPAELSAIISCAQPASPHLWQTRGNSNVTESDSLSETPKNYSYVSSPVDSFFDTVTSPELSSINMADSGNMSIPQQRPLFQENASSTRAVALSSGMNKYDQASAVIDHLAAKKPLPEKGKLLQAVMDAGPLLNTLLVAGPLPQWRNPPPMKPLQIPPLAVKARNTQAAASAKPTIHLVQGSSIGLNYERPNKESCQQLDMDAVSNFPRAPGLCMNKRPMVAHFANNYQSITVKRQRSQ